MGNKVYPRILIEEGERHSTFDTDAEVTIDLGDRRSLSIRLTDEGINLVSFASMQVHPKAANRIVITVD